MLKAIKTIPANPRKFENRSGTIIIILFFGWNKPVSEA